MRKRLRSNVDPRVIFEDGWMVVVDKPAGMVTNNSQTTFGTTVQNWFKNRYSIDNIQNSDGSNEFLDKGGVVHRLDKDTSGILVLAKTPEAYANLKQQFLERKTKKTYLTLVHGKVKQESGIVSLPIVRNPGVWGKFMIGEDLSKTAITEYRIIKIFDSGFTNLEIKPLTGRTHQIRVHMKHLGHPIVSDPLYLGRKQLMKDLEWCPRLFLHAALLELRHPNSDEKMTLESKIPMELNQVLARLGRL